ncbi:hypothetical protein Tco_1411101 [Tanacetum coccineum]
MYTFICVCKTYPFLPRRPVLHHYLEPPLNWFSNNSVPSCTVACVLELEEVRSVVVGGWKTAFGKPLKRLASESYVGPSMRHWRSEQSVVEISCSGLTISHILTPIGRKVVDKLGVHLMSWNVELSNLHVIHKLVETHKVVMN